MMRDGEQPALLSLTSGNGWSSLDEIIELDKLVMEMPKVSDAWCAIPGVIDICGNWNLIDDIFVCGNVPTRPVLDEWVQEHCIDSMSAWGGHMFHDGKVWYRRGLSLRMELIAVEEGCWRVYLKYGHIIGSRFLGYAKPEVELFKRLCKAEDARRA